MQTLGLLPYWFGIVGDRLRRVIRATIIAPVAPQTKLLRIIAVHSNKEDVGVRRSASHAEALGCIKRFKTAPNTRCEYEGCMGRSRLKPLPNRISSEATVSTL